SRFVQRLIMIILHLLIMTFAIYMRPLGSATAKQGSVQIGDNYTEYNTTAAPTLPAKMISAKEVFRYFFEAITVLNSVITLFMHIDEVREQGVLDFCCSLGAAPPRASFLISCLLISATLPSRVLSCLWIEQKQTFLVAEETLLIIAVPCAWGYLLFFAGGTQLNGTFVTMIYKMIRGDMARFGIIYSIVLVCFAQDRCQLQSMIVVSYKT
uniref:XK-related protein n=1 Tax=Macrostomum lignano TaxID=282301 RepID=A0A1I8JL77_9PLAT